MGSITEGLGGVEGDLALEVERAGEGVVVAFAEEEGEREGVRLDVEVPPPLIPTTGVPLRRAVRVEDVEPLQPEVSVGVGGEEGVISGLPVGG